MKASSKTNQVDNNNELLSLALRILSHISDTDTNTNTNTKSSTKSSTLSAFQVSMSIISITRIILATEPTTTTTAAYKTNTISNRYSSSLRITNTNTTTTTNTIINNMLTDSIIASSSSQSISNILWSLGTISCPIPQRTLDLIYDRFALVYKDMNDQAIANILIGLYRAGVTWVAIPVMVQSILCSAICRECLRMSPQSVCNILYSLGGLGATYNVLTERVILAAELALRKVCIQMKGRDASQALVGLATMNIQWSMLSNDTKDRLSMSILKRANEWSGSGDTRAVVATPATSSIEVLTIISHLVRMKASWADLTPPLKASILLALQSFSTVNGNGSNITTDGDGDDGDVYIRVLYYFSLLGLPLKSLPV